MKLNKVINLLEKKKSVFKVLKDNKVKLTPEERKEVMDRKAVWHFNGGSPSPAVWKSKKPDGSFAYITNTHRAAAVEKSLKAAINKYHSFIKGTA